MNVPSKPGMQVCKPWRLLNSNCVSLGNPGGSDFRKKSVRHQKHKLPKITNCCLFFQILFSLKFKLTIYQTNKSVRETETRARECDSHWAAARAA
jgi:hypothetical protein